MTADDIWYPALRIYAHRCPARDCRRLVDMAATWCCIGCQYRTNHEESCDQRHAERQATSGGGVR